MSLTYFLLLVPGALLAPIIHEWTKARISDALGDNMPREAGFTPGRLSRYFEPVGFIFMLAFMVGWGQPVPTDPLAYKNRRAGILLTHALPIFVSIGVGLIAVALLGAFHSNLILWAAEQSVLGRTWAPAFVAHLHSGVFLFAQCNINLGLFSLLPVHPLGGSKILPLLLSPQAQIRMSYYEKPLQVLMVILLLLGVLSILIDPVRVSLMQLVWL